MPTPSGSGMEPTLRGLRKWSISFSVYIVIPARSCPAPRSSGGRHPYPAPGLHPRLSPPSHEQAPAGPKPSPRAAVAPRTGGRTAALRAPATGPTRGPGGQVGNMCGRDQPSDFITATTRTLGRIGRNRRNKRLPLVPARQAPVLVNGHFRHLPTARSAGYHYGTGRTCLNASRTLHALVRIHFGRIVHRYGTNRTYLRARPAPRAFVPVDFGSHCCVTSSRAELRSCCTPAPTVLYLTQPTDVCGQVPVINAIWPQTVYTRLERVSTASPFAARHRKMVIAACTPRACEAAARGTVAAGPTGSNAGSPGPCRGRRVWKGLPSAPGYGAASLPPTTSCPPARMCSRYPRHAPVRS